MDLLLAHDIVMEFFLCGEDKKTHPKTTSKILFFLSQEVKKLDNMGFFYET